ncbi:MAG: heme o synthase, partial [Alphaproteobacteria bacterium]
GVPMLPVVAGRRETKRQILLYAVLLLPVTLAPYALGLAGPLYASVASAAGLLFVAAAIRLWFDEGVRGARQMFGFSILHLFLLFAVLLVDRLPAGAG